MIYIISIIQGIALIILGIVCLSQTERLNIHEETIERIVTVLEAISETDTSQSKAIDALRRGLEAVNMVNEKQTTFLLVVETADQKFVQAGTR